MKKYLIYLFAVVLLAAVSLPARAAAAEAFNIDGTGTVTITSGQAAGDKASTFQFSLNVDSPDAVRVEFRFRENLAKVREFRYDSDGKRLSVYVAAESALFTADAATLTVGQVVVLDGGGNAASASVSVVENSFRYVYGTELKQGTDMQLPGTVQIGRQDPDPVPPPEDDDDDWQDDDDSWEDDTSSDDDNASQGGAESNPGTNPPPVSTSIPQVTAPPQGGGNTSGSNPPQGNTGSKPTPTKVPQVTAPPQGGGNTSGSNTSQGSTGSKPTPTAVPQKTAPPQGGGNTPGSDPSQGSNNASQGSGNDGVVGGIDGSQGKPPQTEEDASSVQTSGGVDDNAKSESGTDILMPAIVIILVVVTVLIIGFAVATVASFNKKRRR